MPVTAIRAIRGTTRGIPGTTPAKAARTHRQGTHDQEHRSGASPFGRAAPAAEPVASRSSEFFRDLLSGRVRISRSRNDALSGTTFFVRDGNPLSAVRPERERTGPCAQAGKPAAGRSTTRFESRGTATSFVTRACRFTIRRRAAFA